MSALQHVSLPPLHLPSLTSSLGRFLERNELHNTCQECQWCIFFFFWLCFWNSWSTCQEWQEGLTVLFLWGDMWRPLISLGLIPFYALDPARQIRWYLRSLASNLNAPIVIVIWPCLLSLEWGWDYRHCLLLENWFDFCNHICILWAPPSLSPPLSLKHMVLIVNVSSSGDYQLLTTFCCCCCCCFPYAPSGLLFKRLSMCSPVMP